LVNTLILVVAGWLFYWFSSAEIFYVHNLEFKDRERLPEMTLATASGLEGMNIFWVNTEVAERGIEALPEVKSARVRCRLPANCIVHVVEHDPLYIWRQGDAQVWIGGGGIVLPAHGELPNAIVLDAVGSTALKPGDEIDSTLLASITTLEWKQPEVRLYQYDEQHGLTFRNALGWEVRLGHDGDIGSKLDLLKEITAYLQDKGIVPTFVDIRYLEAPYYGQ
jgi:cell division septal protein FtsQ